MSRSHLTSRSTLTLILLVGVAWTGATPGQPGWGHDPGPDWGPRSYQRGYDMDPGMRDSGAMDFGRDWRRPSFKGFDRDADGYLSQSEFNRVRAERERQRARQGFPMRGAAQAPDFSSIDQDGDSRLSPNELRDYRYERRRSWRGWR